MFNMPKSQKKKKENAKKNKKLEEHKKGKFGKDREGSSKKTFPNKQIQNVIHGT